MSRSCRIGIYEIDVFKINKNKFIIEMRINIKIK